MLNKIWFGLLFLGIIYGFGKAAYNSLTDAPAAAEAAQAVEAEAPAAIQRDRRNFQEMGRDLNAAALGAVQTSVEICIKLIGIMALWLGLLNIAKDAGLVDALARLLAPLMRWLFPEVPDGHPAQGAMLMNISANMLGLDNAATPMGLKAMQELQTLNPEKDTATNAMATFLAVNTSNVTIVPITIIAYRVAAGSNDPAGPLVWIFLTTLVTTIVAIVAVRFLSRLPGYAMSSPTAKGSTSEKEA
jgi:spore maturation protein A